MTRNQIAQGPAPAPSAPSGCGDCGHPFTLHSNGETACKAAGCHVGPEGAACEGFTGPGQQAPELLAS